MATITVPTPSDSQKIVEWCGGVKGKAPMKMVTMTITVNSTYAAADTLDLSSIFPNKIVGFAAPALDSTGTVIPVFATGASGSPVGCTLKLYIQNASDAFVDASTTGNSKAVTMTIWGY